MAYYLDLFSPETYEAFGKSAKDISGFRKKQDKTAHKIKSGDKLICYMTKLSRWVGILEIINGPFIDNAPIFYNEEDPFIVRFKVKPTVWLPKNKTIPIHDDVVWNTLSFTKKYDKNTSSWTGKLRGSLVKLDNKDGKFLEEIISSQLKNGIEYPFEEEKYKKFLSQRIRGLSKMVNVIVPEDEKEEFIPEKSIRDSAEIQALLAKIGELMHFNIWVPKQERTAILNFWKPSDGSLLDRLPLNYDETTLKTIEQIDVLWLKRRSIIRAFEVEHTTAVYSGILRMADLLSLQPNMNIKLHIVAPAGRKDKFFQEIQRPVFSLLERGPLSDCCSFISYDSLRELQKDKHLSHMSDSVLEDFAEEVES